MAYDFNSLTKQAPEASNRDGFYTDFEDVDPNKLHQISELTDWMRTKAKGSDVREVIAQLFERTWLESIKEGNANFEVAQARGAHPNLKSRLDESDKKQRQNTAQLAQKANKDEVTNVMTPKGNIAYASLPMTGNSVGWYYYCPDGDGVHGAGNYVWNGTSWYFGGTGDEGYNLLKKDLVNLKSVYNDETFNFVGGYNYFNYDFIAGHNYRLTNDSDSMIGIWTANSNDEVIETISGGADTHIVFDFNCSTNAEKIKIFAHGIGTLKIVDQSAKINEIENDISNISKKIVVGRNKFNKYDITTGYFLMYSTGEQNIKNDWCFTDFTEIKPSTEYYTNAHFGHYCFYDEDKKYISGAASSYTFTTPSTAKYIRASAPINSIDYVYIYEGNSADKYEPFKYKFIYDDENKQSVQSVIVVDKSGNGDYTSVTSACADAPEGSTIFIKSGVYDNEVIVGTWSKKLYLVGESAKDTIIKNSLGDYNRPPIQIGSGYLKNITFYSEYTGTQERGTGATMSYAVHSESDNLANDNLTIEDCILISDYAPSFGMGMRGGCNVTLKNCYLKGNYSGSLLFHDADNISFVGEQNISVIDCVLYETNAHPCIIMQSQERQGTTINLEMIRNRIKTQGSRTYGTHNYYGGTGGENDFLGLINLRLKETSWGNSDNTFNKD